MKKTLSSRSQKTVKPLSTPKLPFNPTLNSQTPSLTSTLSESPSSLRTSLLSIPFSSIGNTHTHTLSLSLSLSLSHTHFALSLYAIIYLGFDSLILSWVCRHLSKEKNQCRQSLGSFPLSLSLSNSQSH